MRRRATGWIQSSRRDQGAPDWASTSSDDYSPRRVNQICASSHAARMKSRPLRVDPATSVHVSSGSSYKIADAASSDRVPAWRVSLLNNSTSKIQREMNGVENACRTAGVTRKIFAPH